MASLLRAREPYIARTALRVGQYCCLTLGGSALGWWVFVTADALWTQRLLVHSLHHPSYEQTPVSGVGTGRASVSDPVLQIEIARIGLEAMVLEGDDAQTLRKAVGHIPGTDLPGNSGNVGLAGHRDTFFRPLRRIRPGDEITLTTRRGRYRYQVTYAEVVPPLDTSVLRASRGPTLTLVTCYPFEFIGSAPQRFIVHASQSEPAATMITDQSLKEGE